jgi:hypothetical protein
VLGEHRAAGDEALDGGENLIDAGVGGEVAGGLVDLKVA